MRDTSSSIHRGVGARVRGIGETRSWKAETRLGGRGEDERGRGKPRPYVVNNVGESGIERSAPLRLGSGWGLEPADGFAPGGGGSGAHGCLQPHLQAVSGEFHTVAGDGPAAWAGFW